ncbi:MAG: hypothetical protein FH756_20480 [Firmicutes bacterium]|nr:hypothetical protein [Bacillota bacterium]
MFKEQRFTVVIILIVVLLVTNLLTWSNIREMQQKVDWLQGNLNSMRSNVTNEVSGIRNVVQQMKNDAQAEARWWTPAEVEFLDINKDKSRVKLSWSLKEYREGSKVILNYQKPGEQEYTQAVPEEESKGRFALVLTVDVPQEPVINLRLEQAGEIKVQRAGTMVEEKIAHEANNLELNYYISVQDGETVRTSEKRSLNLNKLNYSLFNPLVVRVKLLNKGEIEAFAHHDLMGKPEYEVEEIYLESRNGQGNVLERWPLEVEKIPEEGLFRLDRTTITRDYASIFVVVKYQEGMKAEKKVV